MVTTASGLFLMRLASAGKSGSPGWESWSSPFASRYCGGATLMIVACTVSPRARTNERVRPTAARIAASRSVAGRKTAETTATLVSGEKSVAGSSPGRSTLRTLRPRSSFCGRVLRTTTLPSE